MEETIIKKQKLVSLVILFLIFIPLLAILVTASFRINSIKKESQTLLFIDGIKKIDLQINALFKPLSKNLVTIKEWGENGLLEIEKEEKLINLISPIVIGAEKIDDITIYSSKGVISRVKRSDRGLSNIQNLIPKKIIPSDKIITELYRLDDSTNNTVATLFENISSRESVVNWFFVPKKERWNLIASVKWNIDSTLYAAVIDINIPKVAIEITKNLPTDSCQLLLVDDNKNTISLSNSAPPQYFSDTLLLTDEIKNILTYDIGQDTISEIITLGTDKKYQAISTILPQKKFRVWLIIPTTQLSAKPTRRRVIWYGVIVVVLLFGIFSVGYLLKYYRQLLRLEHASKVTVVNSKEELISLIENGESDTLEFKSTVRYNIHAKKNGREIELAWLKNIVAFLNTDGGSILLGVTDDGEIFGLKKDAFANDDKCLLHINTLIKRHIGPQFINSIAVNIIEVDEKQVVHILVSPITTPAYLKDGDSENYYIRTGPSATKMSVSAAIAYIEKRKKTK